MVHGEVWPIGPREGMLCIGCLESRIGRNLTPADFTSFPINTNPRQKRTVRLLDRLGPVVTNSDRGKFYE